MPDLKFLEEYSGQTVDQLLALEGEYRIDSLVLVFEEALQKKAYREGDRAINDEERLVLAIEALEREVNNGGYQQFFVNSSKEFAPVIVRALERIGCPENAAITQRAIDALHLSSLTVEAIEMAIADGVDEEVLDNCDKSYFAAREEIAGRLFAFIKANKSDFTL
jgi:hypothetical protein